jgi:hypothetical protein
VKRAVDLFRIEWRPFAPPYVEQTWQAPSAPDDSFISVAAIHWELVVSRSGGAVHVTVRGPETRATIVDIPPETEFFGVEFSLATYTPLIAPRQLVDRAVTFAQPSPASFLLDGSAWEIPTPDNVDVFIDRLATDGLLRHDPIAAAALRGDATRVSKRSVERHVSRATGLTRGVIRQIRRAETAVQMLTSGASARDVARRAGYSDQAHLTRSLTRFFGQTPAQITAAARP